MPNVQFSTCKIDTKVFSHMDKNRVLRLPDEEPMGILVTSKGQKVYIEFVHEGKGLYDDDSVIKNYRGPGIYLLDCYEGTSDYIPIWVVLKNGANLTVGDTKRILNRIENILVHDEHETNNFWTLDGKQAIKEEPTFRNAVHNRIFNTRQYLPLNFDPALSKDFRAHWKEN